MVYFMENPIQTDDLGVYTIIFGSTPTYNWLSWAAPCFSIDFDSPSCPSKLFRYLKWRVHPHLYKQYGETAYVRENLPPKIAL